MLIYFLVPSSFVDAAGVSDYCPISSNNSPSGVGMGRKPQVWLKDGDVIEVGLENVGTWYV